MRLTGFPSIVINSVLMTATTVAATRPHYGGTLHVQTAGTVTTLDPADTSQAETLAARNILALMFDTLVVLNERGQPQPGLAISWQAEPGSQRWQFVLRPGVRFSDQAPMTPEDVAASLRRVNPAWKVTSTDTVVVIQLDTASPDLPAELALARNGIVKIESGKAIGTGSFVLSQWDPGKRLSLSARDDYWAGRAFLDSIEIDNGKNFREQAIAFDMGQSQLIEIPPDQTHHATEARQLRTSEPNELVALVFARDAQTPEEAKQRQALALSIDRQTLNRVVLQGGGEPAGSLLPDWLTGDGFLFPVNANLIRAQQLRAEIPQAELWNLGFDVNDPLARVLAERILLNANDAGLRLQLASQGNPDIRLVRVRLLSLDPHVALMELAKSLGISPPRFLGSSADDLYHAESAIMQSQRVIPLLYLRTAWAVSKSVRNMTDGDDGTWRLPETWLAKP
jgi:ABC-type transport system substrate-binding protein